MSSPSDRVQPHLRPEGARLASRCARTRTGWNATATSAVASIATGRLISPDRPEGVLLRRRLCGEA